MNFYVRKLGHQECNATEGKGSGHRGRYIFISKKNLDFFPRFEPDSEKRERSLGIINETSNMYYLPRFSLNEKYGEIERVKFAASSKGLGVYDFIPSNPTIDENPPFIGFSLLDEKLTRSLNCFIFDMNGQVEREIYKFNERIEIRLSRELSKGRSRMNCTAKDSDGNWRWFGHQFYK